MKNVFRRIKRDKLSVRDTEKLVKNLKSPKLSKKNIKSFKKNQNIVSYENSLIECLGSKVIINRTKNKNSINIHFSDDKDLDRIINLILNEK